MPLLTPPPPLQAQLPDQKSCLCRDQGAERFHPWFCLRSANERCALSHQAKLGRTQKARQTLRWHGTSQENTTAHSGRCNTGHGITPKQNALLSVSNNPMLCVCLCIQSRTSTLKHNSDTRNLFSSLTVLEKSAICSCLLSWPAPVEREMKKIQN